jgi:hypothetical protein
MTRVSISKLKANPSEAILQAIDYPVAVEKRNEVQAYLIGKGLYEKLISFIEDSVDSFSVLNTDFSKGKDFEKVAAKLGI